MYTKYSYNVSIMQTNTQNNWNKLKNVGNVSEPAVNLWQ